MNYLVRHFSSLVSLFIGGAFVLCFVFGFKVVGRCEAQASQPVAGGRQFAVGFSGGSSFPYTGLQLNPFFMTPTADGAYVGSVSDGAGEFFVITAIWDSNADTIGGWYVQWQLTLIGGAVTTGEGYFTGNTGNSFGDFTGATGEGYSDEAMTMLLTTQYPIGGHLWHFSFVVRSDGSAGSASGVTGGAGGAYIGNSVTSQDVSGTYTGSNTGTISNVAPAYAGNDSGVTEKMTSELGPINSLLAAFSGAGSGQAYDVRHAAGVDMYNSSLMEEDPINSGGPTHGGSSSGLSVAAIWTSVTNGVASVSPLVAGWLTASNIRAFFLYAMYVYVVINLCTAILEWLHGLETSGGKEL